MKIRTATMDDLNEIANVEADLTDEMYEKAAMHNEDGAWQMIFGVKMLMCDKVTHKNLIDNRPLFRYYSSIWIEKASLIQYNKVSGRYLYEGKNTNH